MTAQPRTFVVGDGVKFKLPDRSIHEGTVVEVINSDKPKVTIKGFSGKRHSLPVASVMRLSRPPRETDDEKVAKVNAVALSLEIAKPNARNESSQPVALYPDTYVHTGETPADAHLREILNRAAAEEPKTSLQGQFVEALAPASGASVAGWQEPRHKEPSEAAERVCKGGWLKRRDQAPGRPEPGRQDDERQRQEGAAAACAHAADAAAAAAPMAAPPMQSLPRVGQREHEPSSRPTKSPRAADWA
jgi:hypothetical protein